MLLLQKLQQRTVVRQVRGIQRHGLGNMRLEGGFALQQPERELQERERPLTGHSEDGVHQRVRLDQGAVQVDTERQRREFGGGCSRFCWSLVGQWFGG